MRPVLLRLYPAESAPRRMRGTAFWLYQNIAGYTFGDHPNEGARRTRQDVLMSTKMPGQERRSPIRKALPLTRTYRPVKRLKMPSP